MTGRSRLFNRDVLGEYLGATFHLSTIEQGALYLMMMASENSRDGGISSDTKELGKITRLGKRFARYSSTLLPFFTEHAGRLFASWDQNGPRLGTKTGPNSTANPLTSRDTASASEDGTVLADSTLLTLSPSYQSSKRGIAKKLREEARSLGHAAPEGLRRASLLSAAERAEVGRRLPGYDPANVQARLDAFEDYNSKRRVVPNDPVAAAVGWINKGDQRGGWKGR